MHQSSFNIIQQFRDLVEKCFKQNKIRILDVGSYGVNGTYKELFLEEQFDYIGLDLQPGPNVDYVAEDPYSWKGLEDESFDVVISGQAFEHVEFPWLIIEEISRKLKINGMACIIAPSRGPEHKYPVDCWRYYPDGFTALAKWAGLKVIESKTCWGNSGFSDGSDQWGDTFCILLKNTANGQRKSRDCSQSRMPGKLNINNPLNSGKQANYYTFQRDDVINMVVNNSMRAKKVLEAGCASGVTGKKLKEVLQSDQYVGVEISHEAARIAEGNLDRVVVADIERDDLADLGLKHGDFDMLVVLDILEHLYNPWDTLSNLSGYLKPGGYVVASIPNVQNIMIIKDLYMGKWKYLDAGILDATHLRFFTHESISELFIGAGFSVTKIDCILNPSIDITRLNKVDNLIEDGNLCLSGLSRDDVLRLYTYQYLVIAQKNGEIAKDVSGTPADENKNMVKGLASIVILTFNQLDYTKKCVESIRKHTPGKHEIIFVDNHSTDGTVKWLKKLIKENSHYNLIANKENLGFAKGCNQGIEIASGEYILLLNNDAIVTKDWLSGMLECLDSSPDIGIVGPMTNSISGPQQVSKTGYTSINNLDEYAASFRSKNRHRRIPLRRIVGFCMLFRKGLVERVGLLDEGFGTGNFEDDDFCLRATLEGYRNLVAGDVFIHHYGSRSFIGNNIPYGVSINSNRKIFNEKWSNIDISTPLGRKLAVLDKLEKAEEYFQRQDIDAAITTLIDSIKYLPDHKEIYIRLAEILIDSERFNEALDTLGSAPDDGRQDPRWHVLNGYCKEGIGLHAEALKHADDARALSAKSSLAHNLRGRLADKDGQTEVARSCFEQAIECDPGCGISYTNLGTLQWTTGDKDSIDLFEKGFLLAPTMPDSISLYHAVVCATGELGRAEIMFRDALDLYPNNKKLAFLFTDVLLQLQKDSEAMDMIQKAIVNFGFDDEMLSAALKVREKIGPKVIDAPHKPGTLSVCMITKNEEKYLARCLASVIPVADEIIVVDTGSSDRTKELATIFGARVYDHPWNNDFSDARNVSLEKAHGAWILVHDADEVLSSRDYDRLRKFIDQGTSDPKAYLMTTRTYTANTTLENWTLNYGEYPDEETAAGWCPTTKTRLFPNDARVRFQNQVHELLEPSLNKAGINIEYCPVPVHHYGKMDQERSLSRGEMYYELGREKILKYQDTKALKELAVQAGELGKFKESLDLWNMYIQFKPDDEAAYFNMASHYLETAQFREAADAAKKAVGIGPGSPGALLIYATTSLCSGDIGEATCVLEDLLRKKPDHITATGALAAAYCLNGKIQNGLELLDKMKRVGHDYGHAIYWLSKKMTQAGREKQAKLLLRTVIDSGYTTLNDSVVLFETLE